MTWNTLLVGLIQGLVCLLLAPLTVGVLDWTKARCQGRQGPAIVQPYRDLQKLLRQEPSVSERAGWWFVAAPVVVFACYGSLVFVSPIFYLPAAQSLADLVLLIALLGLARLAMGLGGLAVGSPLGGLGSSREMYLHALVEPVLILSLGALAMHYRTTDLAGILSVRAGGVRESYLEPAFWLILFSLALIVLAECGRLPFDNPASHLELTMFGKAIHIEYSGPHWALLEWAEWVRLLFLLTLVANMLAPWLLARPEGGIRSAAACVLLYPAKLMLLAAALGRWETSQIKTRLRGVSTLIVIAGVFSLIAIVLFVLHPS